eukprot:gene10307-19005_t
MIRGKPSPWLTLEIKNAMDERDYNLKTARRTNAEADWLSYRRARNFVTHTIRQSKARNCRNLLHETCYQPRDFSKSIKKFYPIKPKSTELPSMIKIHVERTRDRTTIAKSFCKFVSTVGSKLQNQVSPLCNSAWKIYRNKRIQNIMQLPATFCFKPSYPSSIGKQLKSLKTSKAIGRDNIPGRMLKDASRELAIPLCFFVNVSMSTGTFPTAEKIAKVTPIYKSGERLIFDNSRPISILKMNDIVKSR